MHVYVHMLVWNDRRYLPDLFASIEDQTYPYFTMRILDNGSTDETVEYLHQYYPHTLVSRNVKNMGFTGGHNQLMNFTFDRLSEDEEAYILVANSDMIWSPAVIEELVKALDSDSELGAVQPKLYRAFGEHVGNEILEETMKSDILDTTGLRVQKNWRMTDRGAGELDTGQYNELTDIFGATGTMALFRASALRSVMENGVIFDADFFAYREDCDLAWRLRRAGWSSRFVPTAIAHHYRGMYGAEKQSWFNRLRNRQSQSPFFAALSTRNQLLMLLKNLSSLDFILSLPFLIMGELPRIMYGFFFEPKTRKRLLEIPRLAGKMLKKRKQIFTDPQVSDKFIRSYVSR
jgi:GT2 family glycosyltransferase